MDLRLCVPNMSSWSTIPTHYYAQCQTIHAGHRGRCPTPACQVQRYDAWGLGLLVWLAASTKASTLPLSGFAEQREPAI